VVLNDKRSAFAEAFRLSWANIQLTIEGPNGVSLRAPRPGITLGVTSAIAAEGKSTHALAFARTAALAGERVVLVDADLRRSGVSRLIDRSPCFTLTDFLQGQCSAENVIAVEEKSGTHFVPSTPSEAAWTSRDLQRFVELVDCLKEKFSIVIIDLPPILGRAETIRLSGAVDSIALIIRWGRTERQFVQFALDALRSAGVVASTAILNDIDLRAQQRRGYRDRSLIYADKRLYRTAAEDREPDARAALQTAAGSANRQVGRPEVQPRDT
jgi:Mrp family chromosome partitioning ATPase